jgi:NADH:ubiquinone oxidoreductase subunit 5 (subunit L)/multisubunit Na+/H+ antiporter MnhA subunit
MSIAWTTILIIALLLPGVGFFAGYWSQERYSRELVKSAAIGDVGMAVFMALVIHVGSFLLLYWFVGFDLSFYIRPLTDYHTTPEWLIVDQFLHRLWPALFYTIAVTILGFLFGLFIAHMVMFGWLRFLATHKWAYDLIKEKKNGTVTTFVMTNITENNRVLMYAGHLEDFFLGTDGCFTYVVLKNGSRYFMTIEGDAPTTTSRTPLFRTPDNATRRWEHLVISGENIANVLFDPIGHFKFQVGEKGQEALDKALTAQTALTEAPEDEMPPG